MKLYWSLLQTQSEAILLTSVASMSLLQAYSKINEICIHHLNCVCPLGEVKPKARRKNWWLSLFDSHHGRRVHSGEGDTHNCKGQETALTRHWFASAILCPLFIKWQYVTQSAKILRKYSDSLLQCRPGNFVLVFIWSSVFFKSCILKQTFSFFFFFICHSQILQFWDSQYFPFSRMTPAGGRSMDELQIFCGSIAANLTVLSECAHHLCPANCW